MRCSRCGHENKSPSRFCRQCGARLSPSTAAKPRKAKDAGAGPGRRHLRWGRMVLLAAGLVLVAGFVFIGSKALKAWQTMPSVPALISSGYQDSIIYDRYGHQAVVLHGSQNRIDVSLKHIAPVMQQAIIDVEDHSFYKNPGFDLKSIARAALADLRHGSRLQGASTITEQLAKNLFLKDNGTLTYKLQEFFLGLKLARTYSKSQVLDMYLNSVYFGDGAFGIAAASNAYFDEPASQLTLAQASLLAGLPQAPSLYDPYVNMKLAKQRQWIVLQSMVRYGTITQAQAVAAYHQTLALHSGAQLASAAGDPYPWFVDSVIQNLETQDHLSEAQILHGGLHIYTTLDPKVYNIAQKAVTYWMNRNFGPSTKSVPFHQAAVVVMNPHTGHIYAIIGGRTPNPAYLSGFNYATQGGRNTGSSIKPIMEYTPAIAKGYTQMSVIQDLPKPQYKHNGAWWPSNDIQHYLGYIDLRDALAISDNNVAVKLLGKIGVQYGFNFATKKFGLPLNPDNIQKTGLAMAIGAFQRGPSPLNMAVAYSTIANGGVRMKPILVTKVTNQYGAVLVQNLPHGTPEFSPQVAYIVTQMMERVFKTGPLPGISQNTRYPLYTTGGGLYPGRPAAGKTGTNNNYVDAWFDGFTPQLLAVVWEGRQTEDLNVPQYTLNRGPAYGATAAGPIWQQIIEQASTALKLPAINFSQPSGIIKVPDVSITSGLLAGPYTPSYDIQSADFIKGTQPTQVGSTHVQEQVVASHPNELWEPGCGTPLQETFLRPESDYNPSLGMPLPLDHVFWPPTKTCTPKTQPSTPPSSPPAQPSGSNNSTAGGTTTPTGTTPTTTPGQNPSKSKG